MDRAPGLSVRLKLTLSYAGFLMLAGALLLAVVWVFLLRYVPDARSITAAGVRSCPTAPTSCAPSSRRRPWSLAFLLVFGLVGGWILAGRMLAPLTRITDATRMAANGSLSHRIELEGRNDEFRELADSFDAMLARLEAHVAEQQRFAANASHELRTPLAITQTLLDVARNDPNRDTGELVERLHAVNARAIDLTEALLLLSRADQRSFTREPVDLSLIAEEATETLLPLAEKHGVTIETSGDITPTVGSHALLLQMTTNLLHNAIVHNLPEHGTVQVSTAIAPRVRRAHGREHRRQAHPAAGLDAHRTVPARHRTHPQRPRRCRPRPGDRQEHHPSTRRNAHHRPPPGRRAPRHGAAPDWRRSRVPQGASTAVRPRSGSYLEQMDMEFVGEVWFWRGPAPWHYVTVPEEECGVLEAVSGLVSYGWGVIPVRATIGQTTWGTSLFPKDGSYLVPVKAAVRDAEGIELGDVVTVHLAVDV